MCRKGRKEDNLSLPAHICMLCMTKPTVLRTYTFPSVVGVIDSGVGKGRLVVDSQVFFTNILYI